jgi:beta-lactamase class A
VNYQPDKTSKNQMKYGLRFYILISFIIGAAISGGSVAFICATHANTNTKNSVPLRESSFSYATQYQFIDPLVAISNVSSGTAYTNVESQINNYVTVQKNNGLIAASVEFRDINKPSGFLINSTDTYYPASLYKIQLMLAYYKIAEDENQSILSQEIYYPGDTDLNKLEEIKSATQIVPGTTYSVEQLIEHMVRFSDNNAAQLLMQYINKTGHYQNYLSVYGDLGINPSTVNEQSDNLTVHNYSIMLRALYNATYLTRNDSERALKLMSETDFTEGIESGVPNGILVAQKFGETNVASGNSIIGKELSDCGIIYYPEHTYLLCVMTKGKTSTTKILEDTIANISRLVYRNMEQTYPN